MDRREPLRCPVSAELIAICSRLRITDFADQNLVRAHDAGIDRNPRANVQPLLSSFTGICVMHARIWYSTGSSINVMILSSSLLISFSAA